MYGEVSRSDGGDKFLRGDKFLIKIAVFSRGKMQGNKVIKKSGKIFGKINRKKIIAIKNK